MIRLLRYEHSLLQGGGRGSWLTSVWPGTLHTGVMGLGYSNIILKGFGRWTEVCFDPRVILTAVAPMVLQLSPHTRQVISAGGLCHVPTIGPGIVRRPPKGYLSFNSIQYFDDDYDELRLFLLDFTIECPEWIKVKKPANR